MQQQPAGPRATPHVWNGATQGPAHGSTCGEARGAVMRSAVLVLRATRLRVEARRTSRARRRSVARVMPKDSD